MSLFHKAQRWLDRAPVRDALDRHSSAGLQIVVLLLSTAAALALLSSLLMNPSPSPALAAGAAACLGVWFCSWLLRRGRFRVAVVLL